MGLGKLGTWDLGFDLDLHRAGVFLKVDGSNSPITYY